MLDQLTIAGQNLISAATSSQYYADIPPLKSGATTIARNKSTRSTVTGAKEAQAELEAFDGDSNTTEPFVKPISDLFLEVFDLNSSQNWLRGRAVVVVLHQLLGGTVERKIREIAKAAFADTALLRYLTLVKNSMWPSGGPLVKDKPARTPVMKKKSRKEANVVLMALIPELAGSVVGRANAQAAARKLWAVQNNERLMQHLAFRLLDEGIAVFFPELEWEKGRL